MKPYINIDEYIVNFPDDVQERLQKIRNAIKKIVPDAGEKISYQIPALTINGKYFIYFAGFKDHVSIYPVTPAVKNSVKGIENYRSGKGTLRFNNDEPLPMKLIQEVIKVRVKVLLDELDS